MLSVYVVFLDLLGFASAVTSLNPEEEASLLAVLEQSAQIDGYEHLESPALRYGGARVQHLFHVYSKFRKKARDATKYIAQCAALRSTHVWKESGRTAGPSTWEMPGEDGKYRSIVFSDSIFLAFNDVEALLVAASQFLVGLLNEGIPVRGGLAAGSFAAFDWGFSASPDGSFRALSPFLGSGVVRAYYAESRGPEGLRLIIHPSAAAAVTHLVPGGVIPLPDEQTSLSASHELNLLWWPWYDMPYPYGENRHELDRVLKSIRASAPPKALSKYDATDQALDRMQAVAAERHSPPVLKWEGYPT
jgi:hypothetical protein